MHLNELGIICALGETAAVVRQRMLELGESGIALTTAYSPGYELPLGTVAVELPPAEKLPISARSRNNRLALAALAQIRPAVNAAVERYGRERIGVVIGTSTSGIAEAETALRQYSATGALPEEFNYAQIELISPAALLATILGTAGPVYVHSNACTSSATALATGARLIRMGLCDAVVAGGVDTLCAFTIAGFRALESVSMTRCNPLSRNRNGINIGEGAALFLMTKEPATVAVRGWGRSSDGYHMSAPDPSGAGARLAIEQARQHAGISASDIDYINLHGTATVQNDAMEARVVDALFGSDVQVSSTKPLTGHALGAAGAIEAGLCWLAMQDDNPRGKLPPHLWDNVADPTLPELNAVKHGDALGRPLRRALSNSFAFGGANAALVLERE